MYWLFDDVLMSNRMVHFTIVNHWQAEHHNPTTSHPWHLNSSILEAIQVYNLNADPSVSGMR